MEYTHSYSQDIHTNHYIYRGKTLGAYYRTRILDSMVSYRSKNTPPYPALPERGQATKPLFIESQKQLYDSLKNPSRKPYPQTNSVAQIKSSVF